MTYMLRQRLYDNPDTCSCISMSSYSLNGQTIELCLNDMSNSM